MYKGAAHLQCIAQTFVPALHTYVVIVETCCWLFCSELKAFFINASLCHAAEEC